MLGIVARTYMGITEILAMGRAVSRCVEMRGDARHCRCRPPLGLKWR